MEASHKIIGFLGKMCQLCAQCDNPADKAMILARIGSSFLEHENYFALGLEREVVVLKKEYDQFQRFFEEASHACFFECDKKQALIHAHAIALMTKISCKTQETKKHRSNVTQLSQTKK